MNHKRKFIGMKYVMVCDGIDNASEGERCVFILRGKRHVEMESSNFDRERPFFQNKFFFNVILSNIFQLKWIFFFFF